MAKVIPFPKRARNVTHIVEEILDSRLTHRNPDVLKCLKKELKELVAKFFTAEEFAATLVLPADLNTEQFRSIEQSFQRVFQEHNEQMIRRTNAMFLELCLSRMKVCELKYQHRSEPN